MARKSELLQDIKQIGSMIKKLNDDVSAETSTTVGVAAQKLHDLAGRLKDKIEGMIKDRVAGHDLPPDVPTDDTDVSC